MSRTRSRWLAIVLPLFFALALSLALFFVATAQIDEPSAPAEPVVRYVATTGDNNGNLCTSSAAPCRTLQHAVGVAVAGDEVRVAEGIYQGTQTITRTLYWEVYSYTQVLYIDKPLTVRGGYSTADWNFSDPETHPTIIDAERSGRGVTIIDTLSEPVNLEGFTITGGDYTGLGNPPGVGNYVCDYTSSDCGGGILVTRSAANLRRLVVWDNVGGRVQSDGGGIHIDDAWAVNVEDSRIISNSAQLGGGIFVGDQYAPITIRNSVFQDNIASGTGGAIMLPFGADYLVTIEQTDFLSNTAVASSRGSGQGGALYIRLSTDGLTLSMNRVRLQNNRGEGLGKVIHLDAAGNFTPTARLTNMLLTGNGLPEGVAAADEDALISVGPGFTNLNAILAHVTAADNEVGGFLFAETHSGDPDLIQVVVTNTLLSGFDDAFIARENAPAQLTVEHDHTLFENVTNQHLSLGGSPSFTASNVVVGNALLDSTYHLQSGSDAIDAGVEAGVSDDIDGQFRPQAAAPDIGADEYLELVGPASLIISGPAQVVANTDNTFTATVGPVNATRPLTYYWSASGLPDIVHTSGSISDNVIFNWPTTGPKSISLTVANGVAGRGETYPLTVISAPALSIVKSGPDEALAGSPIIYALTVANGGVAGASGLVITDSVPANTTSVTALDGGSVSNGVVQWNLTSLAGGSEATVRFQVTADQTITNDDYAVTAIGGYAAVGTSPVTTVVGQPQLSIAKSGPFAVAPGQDIVYHLTISNTGLISATNVVVSDTLPAGAAYVSGGQLLADVVRWELDSVAGDGGAAQVSFTASANATITNGDYRVKAAGGFGAQGTAAVSTIVGAGTRYVAKSGADGLNNCTNSASPCATIQHAVDVANPGEEIRVASGTYAGTSWTTSDVGYDYKQIVFVAKGVTLRGGYSASDWNNADPLTNPTILDAQGDGRGLTILNTENDAVTVEGFTITGGNYTGLGNTDGISNLVCNRTGFDCGGGIFISNSAANLRHLIVHDNSAGGSDSVGGGIFIWPARAATIEYTEVTSNSAGYGGGLYVADTILPMTINDSTFQDNVAEQGGGLHLDQSLEDLVTLNRVAVLSNMATTKTGGGIYARLSAEGLILAMDRVRLQGNQAYGQGKALYLDAVGNEVPRATISNLLLSDNGPTAGAPLSNSDAVIGLQSDFSSLEADLFHVTAAGNPAASFLYVEPRDGAGYFATVALTNTLLAGLENAYVANETGLGEATIYHQKTLFHDVSNQHLALGGSPTFTAVDAVTGDPKLDGSYHLTAGSAAIDAAVATGVSLDIDGDSRPLGGGPDIGADEYVPAPPANFRKVNPANDAANQPTAPTLTWEASIGAASYEVCYDTTNNSACDASWLDAGNALSKVLGGLSSGTTCYWQVRAVNLLGEVEADGGTWWSFTTGAPPAAFGKSGPASGAGNQTTAPTLSWGSAAGAASYEYCVDTLNNGICDADWQDAGSNLDADLSGLAYGTTYYWQARAVNAIGQTEANGGTWWLFTTGNLPGLFGKSNPADGATIEATSTNLSWTESSDAVSYEICVDAIDNDDCDDAWTAAGSGTTTSISSLSMGATYYWQVRAVNSLGSREADDWAWWSFSVASPPAAFGKSAPADEAVDQSSSPTLSWVASAGAGAYEYCIDTTDGDSCDGSWISAGSNTSVALTGLQYKTVYYWQVRAKNGLGTEAADGGAWWSFTTGDPPYSVRIPLVRR